MSTAPLLHVVAGVIYNAHGQVLIARRAAAQHQGGLWEFPGGKLEAGEAPAAGLARELDEELGIRPRVFEPLIQVVHHYPNKSVLLDVWQVSEFDGEPWGREAQPWRWVAAAELAHYEFPAANLPILKAIKLPRSQAITGHAANREAWMAQLEKTLASGVQSVQLRSASLPASQLLSYVPDAAKLCRAAGAPLILNSRLGPLPQLLEQPCDGVHFRREDWQMLSRRPLPAECLFSVACHSADELAAVQALDADVALLSPVLPTRSHPQAGPLGWSTFAQLCLAATVPVMALGGLGWADLPMAKSMGAQGIAGISGFWPE